MTSPRILAAMLAETEALERERDALRRDLVEATDEARTWRFVAFGVLALAIVLGLGGAALRGVA